MEIVHEGRKDIKGSLLRIAELFGTDITKARVQRLDLAIDVPEVPVAWFRDHVTVQYKRTLKEHICQKATADLQESLSYGRRPNQIVIYDKQLQAESVHGISIGGTLTRVERRYGGKGLPKHLRDVGTLLESVVREKPFEIVRIRTGNATLSLTALDGLTAEELVSQAGYNVLRSQLSAPDLNQRLGHNRARIHSKYEGRLPRDTFQMLDLASLFQSSIRAQLAGPISKHAHSN